MDHLQRAIYHFRGQHRRASTQFFVDLQVGPRYQTFGRGHALALHTLCNVSRLWFSPQSLTTNRAPSHSAYPSLHHNPSKAKHRAPACRLPAQKQARFSHATAHHSRQIRSSENPAAASHLRPDSTRLTMTWHPHVRHLSASCTWPAGQASSSLEARSLSAHLPHFRANRWALFGFSPKSSAKSSTTGHLHWCVPSLFSPKPVPFAGTEIDFEQERSSRPAAVWVMKDFELAELFGLAVFEDASEIPARDSFGMTIVAVVVVSEEVAFGAAVQKANAVTWAVVLLASGPSFAVKPAKFGLAAFASVALGVCVQGSITGQRVAERTNLEMFALFAACVGSRHSSFAANFDLLFCEGRVGDWKLSSFEGSSGLARLRPGNMELDESFKPKSSASHGMFRRNIFSMSESSSNKGRKQINPKMIFESTVEKLEGCKYKRIEMRIKLSKNDTQNEGEGTNCKKDKGLPRRQLARGFFTWETGMFGELWSEKRWWAYVKGSYDRFNLPNRDSARTFPSCRFIPSNLIRSQKRKNEYCKRAVICGCMSSCSKNPDMHAVA
ncbi:lipid transfer protein [Striga asiatica]|uniref:Lipid transfer protein n=1 Tax=Striga asiatica TaxID=4170 RepID=A0A5A7QCI4_STRAF|nr:lipid transfer protein [Striga asiatica]